MSDDIIIGWVKINPNVPTHNCEWLPNGESIAQQKHILSLWYWYIPGIGAVPVIYCPYCGKKLKV